MSLILTHMNMPYIPQEILDKIIGFATADDFNDELDVRQISRIPSFPSCISFVSHTFHQIVLPHKFKPLTFEFHNRHSIGIPLFNRIIYTTHIPIPKFSEAINTGDAHWHALSLTPLVRELSLVYWSGKNGFGSCFMLEPFGKILNGVFSFQN